MKRTTILALAILPFLAAAPALAEGEIGFVEDYVFAADKDEAIKQLIPGTEEYYYYLCLKHQAAGELDKVDGLLKTWLDRNRNNRTPTLVEIEHRQALLRYKQDPDGTLRYLADKLGVRFDHQRQVARKSDLPTLLDDDLISRQTLTKRAMANRQRLEGFNPSALEWLIATDLDPRQRRHLLEMLARPDHEGLVKLIADDLAEKDSGGFGSLGIHGRLLKAQLEELVKLRADQARNSNFVNAYLTRLRPSDDVNWREQDEEKLAYLDRLWSYLRNLDPAFNSLKTHVLYHRLAFDRDRGTYDQDLFLAYLQLPRQAPYVLREYLQRPEHRNVQASLGADFQPQTLLHPVGHDEPLVRDYLERFLLEADTYEPYAKYLQDTYLKQVFAETKLLGGVGDAAKWTAMLSPAQYRALTERVDLDFAPTNPRWFGSDEKVQLDVHVKNVQKLIVKVFRINALKYYQDKSQPVPMDLDLDGLVANEQKTYEYDDAPIRRVRRRFEFASLSEGGVYVIELIGSGKRSRALVRKGRLDFLVRTTPAGHEFTVLNESGAALPDAQLWVAGHLYEPDKDGRITVPFSTSPTRQQVVLLHKGFASLGAFGHMGEGYSLTCGLFVDRETLLRGAEATLVVRPQLRLNGSPVSLSLLKEVELFVASTDLDGVQSTQRVKDFELFEDRESTYVFRVPDRLAKIEFRLTGKVENLSQARQDALAAARGFQLNGIDATGAVEQLGLLRTDGRHVLEMLGRNGEPLAERPVHVTLRHRDFRDPVNVVLKTDAKGRTHLGALKDIVLLEAAYGQAARIRHAWRIGEGAANDLPRTVHGKAGQTVRLPYVTDARQPQRSELSLLELRDGAYVADRFDALKLAGGMLELRGLPAGDYSLLLKRTGLSVAVRLTDGHEVDGFWVGRTRRLERRDEKPVQIVGVSADKDAVKVQLANVTKFTRVHVAACRYEPEYELFGCLHPFGWLAPSASEVQKELSLYVAGRRISDEYRYILDRQYAAKFPGNMLKRPSWILNPWSPRDVDTGRAEGEGGEAIPSESARPGTAPASAFFGTGGKGAPGVPHFADLDFLANPAVVWVNLRPDAKGVVTIPRKDLKDKQLVRVLAADPEHTAFREISLGEAPCALRDLRLDDADALDPQKHFVQQKTVTPAPKGQALVLRDVTATRFETFDSLEKVYRLYTTLSGDAKLREFAFVLTWPTLKDDQKRAKYSEYACHELHFFLYRRDPEFFRAVVLPYLKNKKDKTFLDQWLCGEDLGEYVKPWRFAQLNVVERILLARRIEAERAAVARHVADRFELLPPDADRFNHLFETALGLSSLKPVQLGEKLGELRDRAPVELAVTAEHARELSKKLKEDMDATAAGLRGTAPAAKTAAAPRLAPPPPPAPETPAPPGEDRARRGRFYDGKEAQRQVARQFYRQLGQVKERVENNYYKLTLDQHNADLIGVNAFWRDYAAWDGQGAFLSGHFAEASRGLPEMMLALAVLDLPFEAPKHKVALKGSSMTITPAEGIVVFHEEIAEARDLPKVMPILVSQNYYRQGERYRTVNGEQIDNFVTEEFLAEEVYGCHVVVTNPTSSKRKLQVLMQVPRGAIPVAKGRYTHAVYVELEPYRTQTFDTFFYFPATGSFDHYGVHVARQGELMAFAPPGKLKVVRELTKVDKASWDYISQNGSDGEVLAFLKANNVERLELARMAWRMQDKAFFGGAVELLAARHAYDHVLWSYALKHNAPAAAREYLQHCDAFLAQCGRAIDSPLLTIDPVVRRTYQHVEFWPLVNARAHVFGARRKILVPRLHEQYHELLNVLRYRAEPADEDLMDLVCYLLMQDRVEEAMRFFRRVNPANLAERLPYDYCTAYLAFYRERPDEARKVAAGYKDHPVDRWRNLFAAVLNQADEIEGKGPAVADGKDRDETQTRLAATEPTFELAVEARKISLTYQNVVAAVINYYLMDTELMFSRQPFVQELGGGQFAYIRPNQTQEVKLPADQRSLTVDLPKELHNRNVMVEVVAGGKTRTQAYYSSSLVVQVMENYGQLRVSHQETGQPVAKAYVKVYAQMAGGEAEFYKDGYTDLRGRFDYTSLNTDQLAGVRKFAMLVLSEDYGSTVREAKPPKR